MIRYKKDINNIVTLTLDMANRRVNIINHEIGKAFFPVLEHLKEEDVPKFINNILDNLKPGGFFVGSINTTKDERVLENGEKIILHQTVQPEGYWRNTILKNYDVRGYPFEVVARKTKKSFYISIHKPGEK